MGLGKWPWRDSPELRDPLLGESGDRIAVSLRLWNAENAMRVRKVGCIDPEPFPTGVEGHGKVRVGELATAPHRRRAKNTK